MRFNFLLAAAFSATLAMPLVGCGDGNAKKDAAPAAGGGHDHPTEGPHEGLLVELGDEEYHAEVCHDEEANKVTVYILDDKAKNAVPVAQQSVTINVVLGGTPSQFVLPAVPLDGESDGKSSRFELSDEKLCEALDAEGAEARLKVTIATKPYEGPIPAHDHDHDDDHPH